MTEDLGTILKAEWDKHQDWWQLGAFVGRMRAESYQSGFTNGEKRKAISAIRAMLIALEEPIN